MAYSKKGDQEDVTMDDGTEGSNVGYLVPGQMESEASEEEPAKKDKVDDDEDLKDEEEEDLDDDDEEESDDEEEEPGELEAQRKSLERDYTTKYRELSKKRGMIQMMEKIQKNPEEMIPWLAEQFGVDLPTGVSEEGEKGEGGLKFEVPDVSDIQPGNDELMPAYINRVLAKSMKGIMEQIPKAVAAGMKKGQPKAGKKNVTLPGMEMDEDPVAKALKALDKKHEDWPLYEDDMIEVLKKKPELIEDPTKLYEEGKKRSGLFGRGTKRKAAKAKKTQRMSSGMRGSGKRKTQKKGKIMSFDDAWERAKVDASKGT